LLAAVRKASAEEIDAVGDWNASNFPLPASDDPAFAGAIVDLGRTFTVGTKSLLSAPDYTRLVSLDLDAKDQLARRWSGYAARHGPIIAEQMATTFAKVLAADGDSKKVEALRPIGAMPPDEYADLVDGIAAALTSAWTLEGPIGDRLLDAWEAGRTAGSLRDAAVEALLSIRDGADAALLVLGERPPSPEATGDSATG
jgi:hypothetical protein